MNANKKMILKDIIKRLHEGENPDEVKKEFKEFLKTVNSAEISQAEEELIREGMPRDQIHKLCEVHLALFKESVESQKEIAPKGHPINILMSEHREMQITAEKLLTLVQDIEKEKREPTDEEQMQIRQLVRHFQEAEKHYLREENVLFPYLEKHGITQPPAIMWMEHDRIREIKKQIFGAVKEVQEGLSVNIEQLSRSVYDLSEFISSHFFKENNILFPTSMKLFSDEEWQQIRTHFDEIGYCCFTPEIPDSQKAETTATQTMLQENEIGFETGTLQKHILEAILNTLPVDITFVDANDTVRYFNNPAERFFVRSKAVLGRKVQFCHPQKSIHKVNSIIERFRKGEKDVAEFWINYKGRLILIRYFAVRGVQGEYLGTLEVTQDITDLKTIKGEKKLLDDET